MLNVAILLLAIATVESGCNDKLIGPKGERSQYQIMQGTFKRYTHAPFSMCRGLAATSVATQHVSVIREKLVLGETSDPYAISLVWKAGFRKHYGYRTHDYAQRVANTYNELMRKEVRQ